MILVVGATGVLGGMITQQLLEKGKSVRILVRPHSNYQPLVEAGVSLVIGDLKDRASLHEACAGIETVINAASSLQDGDDDTLESVDLYGTLGLIDVAKLAGVRHFIYTSAYGSNVRSSHPFFKFKARCEYHLRNTGMFYTILLPDLFMEVWIETVVGIPLRAGQPVTLVGKGDHKHAFVSALDVAAFATAAVDNPAARNRCLLIGGPKSYSWTEVVKVVGQIIGQELPLRYVAPDQQVPLIPESLALMMPLLETFETYLDMSETASTFGVTLTPLETFVRRAFAGTAVGFNS